MLSSIFAAAVPILTHAAGSASLAWDPSPTPTVVGYKVYLGGVSGTYTNSRVFGDVTNGVITGLIEGRTYFFAATAVDDSALESDLTAEISYTVPFPPNQAPTLNAVADVTVNENAAQQAVALSGISSGATNESQTLTVTAASSNTGLVPNPTVTYTSPNATGSLTFRPLTNTFGSATITVTVNDGAASNNITYRSFTVTVNPVNQPPTLNPLANLTLNETAGQQTVALSGISAGPANEPQAVAVTVASSNTGLIPVPTVNYTSPNATGSLVFTPVALASGSATVTVTVNDGGASNSVVSRSFTVTINSINQAPTLDPLANVTINENAPQQTVALTGISSGANNEFQTLTVTAASSNTGLVPTPTITYTSASATGSLAFKPATNAFGSATITVTVNDGGASNNVVSRTFSVTVNQVNQPPTISSLTNVTVVAGAGIPALPFTVGDPDNTVASLTVTGSSSNPALVQNSGFVFNGTGANRTLSITPVAGQSGTAALTLTVSDGLATASTTFQLTVRSRPAPPSNLHIAGP